MLDDALDLDDGADPAQRPDQGVARRLVAEARQLHAQHGLDQRQRIAHPMRHFTRHVVGLLGLVAQRLGLGVECHAQVVLPRDAVGDVHLGGNEIKQLPALVEHGRDMQLVPEGRAILAVVEDFAAVGRALLQHAVDGFAVLRSRLRPLQEPAVAPQHLVFVIAGQPQEGLVDEDQRRIGFEGIGNDDGNRTGFHGMHEGLQTHLGFDGLPVSQVPAVFVQRWSLMVTPPSHRRAAFWLGPLLAPSGRRDLSQHPQRFNPRFSRTRFSWRRQIAPDHQSHPARLQP